MGAVMSLDQHLNKAQRNMLFDIFSAAAMCDLPVASAVESITLVSEQQEDIMTISRVIRETFLHAPLSYAVHYFSSVVESLDSSFVCCRAYSCASWMSRAACQ
jgi:hypothetical protein